jgi:hypothetical protein
VGALARGLTALRRRVIPDGLAIVLYVILLGSIVLKAKGWL